ncbi:MAG: peptidylprolyl isomerase, partial [Bacilli bacterium]|nr:peptidylprolyl isomerase [Bacilli bacterium]
QTGDPTATGTGGSKETIKGEFENNGVKNPIKHEKGVISMARASGNMDSASSQFFIMVSDDHPYLDGDYAAFGHVIAGYEAIEEISKVKTDENDKPYSNQIMHTLRFVNVTKQE